MEKNNEINDKYVEAYFNDLHLAVYNGEIETVEELIEKYGNEINSLTKESHVGRHFFVRILTIGFWNKAWNETALHIAARQGYTGIVETLLDAGINRGITNNQNQTAADIADERGFHKIAEKIRNHHTNRNNNNDNIINNDINNNINNHRNCFKLPSLPPTAVALIVGFLGFMLSITDIEEIDHQKTIAFLMMAVCLAYLGVKAGSSITSFFSNVDSSLQTAAKGIEKHGVGNAHIQGNRFCNIL